MDTVTIENAALGEEVSVGTFPDEQYSAADGFWGMIGDPFGTEARRERKRLEAMADYETSRAIRDAANAPTSELDTEKILTYSILGLVAMGAIAGVILYVTRKKPKMATATVKKA